MIPNKNYPLPHEGQRTQVNEYAAIIEFPDRSDIFVFEIKDGFERNLPHAMPKTYALQARGLKFYYFANTPYSLDVFKRLAQSAGGAQTVPEVANG